MKTLSRPAITVGIVADDDASFGPRGRWNIESGKDKTIFTPLDTDSIMEIEGVVFGRNFHWEARKTRQYRGSFMLLNTPTSDGFRIINRLPVEDYVRSVVASEMHPQAPEEFVKAHAIMSRTWALRKLLCHDAVAEERHISDTEIITWDESDLHNDFTVCSDDHCQRYQGISDNEERVRKILNSVEGLILTAADSDLPADARFSKCCGGVSELFSSCWANREFSYLISVIDPYCDPARMTPEAKKQLHSTILHDYDSVTPYYDWQVRVSRDLIHANLLKHFGVDKGEILDIRPLQRGVSGRITRLLIAGSAGNITVGKELAIRRLLSDSHLYSSNFRITATDEEGFTLSGQGWGHGVGLCQIGAAVMALEGKSATEILSFYFPTAKIRKIY